MAFTVTDLETNEETTTATSSTTGSFTTTVDKPVVLFVGSSSTTPNYVDSPTITKTGCSFGSRLATAREPQRNIYVYACVPTSTSTGTATIDFSGNNQTQRAWGFIEVDGADTTTPNVQAAASAANSTDQTATLGSAITAGNEVFAGIYRNNIGVTLESGWAFVNDFNDRFETAHHAAGTDNSVTFTLTTAKVGGVAIVEIAALAAGTAVKDILGGGLIPWSR